MKRYIGESIEPQFHGQPLLSKKAGCPSAFHWRGKEFVVEEMLAEWHEYERHGRMELNLTPAHAQTARKRGSLGVGRDYYKIRAEGGRVFTIYYDRAPRNAADRKGNWILLEEEVMPEENPDPEKHEGP
jgi:hypothetical protein